MSKLQNKSDILIAAAELSHDNYYYPAVAHSAYYSCYQLLKYIWLYNMNKTQDDLDSMCSQSKKGSHEYLINEIDKYIKQSSSIPQNYRDFRNKIVKLKKLRVEADYKDSDFYKEDSDYAISLAKDIRTILKQL